MRHEVTTRRLLYEIPGMAAIQGEEGEFQGAGGMALAMRTYAPPSSSNPRSAVVIVDGYPDAGFSERLGCRFMDMEWSISLAQLIAASGMTAITHSNRTPAADAIALMQHLASRGFRLAIWATSGHAPVALAAMEHTTCGVLTNPIVGDTMGTKPLYLVRSGHDETPGLNAALDRFVGDAIAANRSLTLVNHPEAPHSFELNHDSDLTRLVLRQALAFLHFHLGVEMH